MRRRRRIFLHFIGFKVLELGVSTRICLRTCEIIDVPLQFTSQLGFESELDLVGMASLFKDQLVVRVHHQGKTVAVAVGEQRSPLPFPSCTDKQIDKEWLSR